MPIGDFKLRYGFLPYDEEHCTGKLPEGTNFKCDIELSPQQAEKRIHAYLASDSARPRKIRSLDDILAEVSHTPRRKGKVAGSIPPWDSPEYDNPPAPAKKTAGSFDVDAFLATDKVNEAYEREVYQQVVADERREEQAKNAAAKEADAKRANQQRRKNWILVGTVAGVLVCLFFAVLLLLRLVRAFSFAITTGMDAARKRSKKD